MKPCREQGEMAPKNEECNAGQEETQNIPTTPAQLNGYVFPNPPAVREVGKLLQDLL